jgi:hypothetical protein
MQEEHQELIPNLIELKRFGWFVSVVILTATLRYLSELQSCKVLFLKTKD